MPKPKRTLEEETAAFHTRYQKGPADRCWEWMGGRSIDSGHGQGTWRGKSTPAHRIAYEIAHGPIPAGLVVRHTCNRASCVNPAHLILGTVKDNAGDRKRAGGYILLRPEVRRAMLLTRAVEVARRSRRRTGTSEKIEEREERRGEEANE